MRLTLTHKFVGAILIALITCCTVVLCVSIHFMRIPLDQELDQDIREMQHILYTVNNTIITNFKKQVTLLTRNPQLINAVRDFDYEQVMLLSKQFMQDTNIDFITVSNKTGMVIWHGHSHKWQNLMETSVEKINKEQLVAVASKTESLYSLRVSQPVRSEDELVGTLSIGIDLTTPDYIDWLKSLSSMEIAFFKDDVCIMSSIIRDGKHLVGEKLKPRIAEAVLKNGEICFIHDDIFGSEYNAAYWPLKTTDGKIVGIWFAGMPIDKMLELERLGIMKSICITIILLIIMLVIFSAIGLHISAPVREITRYIIDVSNNKKGAALHIYSNDDMGKLSEHLRNMVLSLQARTEQFRELSYRDQLTGLWNRRYFMESIQREIALSIRHGYELSLGIADIDHFKKVNDTYGHDAGDVVLKHIADILRQNLRSSDIVARYGGEEFIILLHNTNLEEATKLFEHLRRLCEQSSVTVNNQSICVTVSFGLVTLPKDTQLPEEALIKHADMALYQSKRNGRNQVTARMAI